MAGGIGSMEFLVTQILLLFQKAIEGFGFRPTEQQLINHLKSGNPGRTEHFCIIPKLGNITDFDPWKLPGEFTRQSILPSNNREWWFICSQTQNPGARITRKTPCGSSWKVTGKPRDIKIGRKKIGLMKILTFHEDKAKEDWIIHEYHLPQDLPNSGNDVLCHLTRKRDEKADKSTTGSEDGKFTLLDAEEWFDQFNDEPVIQGISPELHTISWPQFMQLLQRELESPSIRQSTNIGSSYGKDFSLENSLTDKSIKLKSSLRRTKEDERADAVPNADLSNAEVQNGEEPDKSIDLESLHGRTECNDWAASLIIENPSDTEVQRGEEPRLEKDHQETAATSTKPCITSDEDAVRAKKGQISTTEDCQCKIESLHCVAPLEETEGLKQSILNSSHLSENCRVSPSLDDAAQAKGLEHEEHKLAGISPKRRRLDVTSPKTCLFIFKKKEG